MQKNEVVVKQLSISYQDKPVVWDVNFSIPKGVCAGILGPNGAGKSSLIKAMIDLVKPLSGQVLFQGETVDNVREKIAYVGQRQDISWDFPITVYEVILMGCYAELTVFQRPSKAHKKAVWEILDQIGMRALAHQPIKELSGGQQQRVFLGRALMQKADIYFFDEPFVGIDMATEKWIVNTLHKLRDQGKTIFIVHHDLSTVRTYFDWVILMNLRLVQAGPVEDVYNIENIQKTFGQSSSLFEEVMFLRKKISAGLK